MSLLTKVTRRRHVPAPEREIAPALAAGGTGAFYAAARRHLIRPLRGHLPLKGKAWRVRHLATRTHQGEGLRVRHSHRGPLKGECLGVRRQERKISAVAEASGRGSLRAGERRHSPFIRQRRQKAMPARIRGKSQLSIAREGFLDRRSKRCFWLLLSPQTKVARAGARNYPRRRHVPAPGGAK